MRAVHLDCQTGAYLVEKSASTTAGCSVVLLALHWAERMDALWVNAMDIRKGLTWVRQLVDLSAAKSVVLKGAKKETSSVSGWGVLLAARKAEEKVSSQAELMVEWKGIALADTKDDQMGYGLVVKSEGVRAGSLGDSMGVHVAVWMVGMLVAALAADLASMWDDVRGIG